MADPRAGQPAAAEDLVDVAKLVTAYYAVHPDPGEPRSGCRSARPGTAGRRSRRRSTRTTSWPPPRPSASTGPATGSTGRCTWAPTRTRFPSLRRSARWRCSPPTACGCMVDARGGYTPTPAVSRAILAHNASGLGPRADGIVVTPSHNPPPDGGFKYNPPDGGPAGTDITRQIQDRANELLADGLEGGAPDSVRPGGRRPTPPGSSTSSTATCRRSGRWWTWPRSGRPGCASAPTRSAGRAWPTGARSATATAWT